MNDYAVFRDGPALADAGYVTLSGLWYVGRWWPNRGPHYIHGVADCEQVAGPFATHSEAESAEAACVAAAVEAGYTADEADECENGELGCLRCPFSEEEVPA